MTVITTTCVGFSLEHDLDRSVAEFFPVAQAIRLGRQSGDIRCSQHFDNFFFGHAPLGHTHQRVLIERDRLAAEELLP